MTVTRGFYRHYRDGDVYFVESVGALQHESGRRIVSYTSVRAIRDDETLMRDEAEFEEWVKPGDPEAPPKSGEERRKAIYQPSGNLGVAMVPWEGYVPRFWKITAPEELRLGPFGTTRGR